MELIRFILIYSAMIMRGMECLWSSTCPRECMCKDAMISQASPKQWFTEGGKVTPLELLSRFHQQKESNVRTASCTVQQDTNVSFMCKSLPEELQVLTILQGEHSRPFTINDKMFRHLQGLNGLEIQGISKENSKQLTVLPDSFSNLRKLQYLNLKNVNISQIESLPFNKLSGLKVLRLIHTDFQFLPINIFHGMTMLEEISLEFNHLHAISNELFVDQINLHRLYLNNNQLQCFESCTGNRSLAKLEILDLSNNNITQISSLSFLPMPNLKLLELKNNPIQVLFPYSFQGLNHLEKLSLGHKSQSLHILQFSFIGLDRLTSLDLPNIDNNVLEYGMFAGLTNVQHLSLHGKIQQVTNNAFLGASNIVHLSLKDCKLRRIVRNALSGLKNLQILDLSNNRLTKLNANVFGQTKMLNELQLQNNQLRDLPRRIFNALPLKSLRLEGNPWNCTCDVAKWKEFAVGRVRKPIKSCINGKPLSKNDAVSLTKCRETDIKYVRDSNLLPLCFTPQQYMGQPVFEVIKKQLKCFKKKKH